MITLTLGKEEDIEVELIDIPKCEELENAGTYVDTPHSDPSTRKPGDIVIHPIDFYFTVKNLLDFDYAVKYYPNCDDGYPVKDKPRNELGLHKYGPGYYDGSYDGKEANERANDLIKQLNTALSKNPTSPGNVAYARILKDTGDTTYAKQEKARIDANMYVYVFNLLQSNRCVFVYNHPHFGINWKSLIEKAGYERYETFISETQRALFNAEGLIRFLDDDYVTLNRRAGYSLSVAWHRNDFKPNADEIKQYVMNLNNKEFNHRYKYCAPLIDGIYNDIIVKGDIPPYERFLRDYNYIKVLNKERNR